MLKAIVGKSRCSFFGLHVETDSVPKEPLLLKVTFVIKIIVRGNHGLGFMRSDPSGP